jgi:CTP:molybdopterin cytidylyltransferase MocA
MESIPGILLGAGSSERFGSEKLLTLLPSGEMLFERVLGIHLQSRILPLIVVVSPSIGKIIRQKTEIFAFSQLRIRKRFDTWHAFSCKWGGGRLIINENFHKGMSSSIKKGVSCLTDDEKAGGTTGHPVIIDINRFKNDIGNIKGDVGLRMIIKKYQKAVKIIPWQDDSVTRDIDTPKDLERLVALF